MLYPWDSPSMDMSVPSAPASSVSMISTYLLCPTISPSQPSSTFPIDSKVNESPKPKKIWKNYRTGEGIRVWKDNERETWKQRNQAAYWEGHSLASWLRKNVGLTFIQLFINRLPHLTNQWMDWFLLCIFIFVVLAGYLPILSRGFCC